MDPLTDKFAWWSPYAFAGNTPIQALDQDGLEIYFHQIKWIRDNSGNVQLKVVDTELVENFSLDVSNGMGGSKKSIPIKFADFGIGVHFVSYNGQWVQVENLNDLPEYGSPLWDELDTYDEYKQTFEAAANFLVSPFSTTANVKGNLKNLSKDVKNLTNLRRKAVRDAWKEEADLVRRTGRGTREWTRSERQELLKNGKVKNYKGHHINSVKDYPEQAGDPNNIIFRTSKEHLKDHKGNWKNTTSGELINRKELINKANASE